MSHVIIGPYSDGLNLKDIHRLKIEGTGTLGDNLCHVFTRTSAVKIKPSWPEASRPWPKGALLLPGTTSNTKILDYDIPLRPYDLRVISLKLLMGSAPADSEERQANSI